MKEQPFKEYFNECMTPGYQFETGFNNTGWFYLTEQLMIVNKNFGS